MIQTLQEQPAGNSHNVSGREEIAVSSPRGGMASPGPAQQEALQLVQRFFILPDKATPHLVLFAGVDSGNGCSEVAAAVAETLADNTPSTVCLLEGNFRSPSLASRFCLTNKAGFGEALLQEEPILEFAHRIPTGNLWVMPAGNLQVSSPLSLGADTLRKRLDDLRRSFDFIIIDTPPLSTCSDALTLARWSDGAVLVIEASTTRREAAEQAVETLREAHVNILGAVLNKHTQPLPKSLAKRL